MTSMSKDRNAGASPTRCLTRSAYSAGGRGAQLVAGDDVEAHRARLVEVLALYSPPRMPGEDRPVGVDQALFERAAERGAVEVALAVVVLPRVGVGVEQDDRERAVHRGVGAQLAEDDRVVAAEDDRRDAAWVIQARPSAICAAVRSALPGVMWRSPPSTMLRRSKTSTPSAGLYGRRRSTAPGSPPARTARPAGCSWRCRTGRRSRRRRPRRDRPGRAGSARTCARRCSAERATRPPGRSEASRRCCRRVRQERYGGSSGRVGPCWRIRQRSRSPRCSRMRAWAWSWWRRVPLPT